MTNLSNFRMVSFCAALVFVAAESSTAARAASNMDNACHLFREKIGWYTITSEASEKWGVPVSAILAIMYQESRFKSTAAAKTTSAFGYSQALDGTWDEYRAATNTAVADRTTLTDSADFIGWYMTQTTTRIGLPFDDVYAHYLTYHEGHKGYQSRRWKRQPKLIQIAQDVAQRAEMYEAQLQQCGGSSTGVQARTIPLPVGKPVALAEMVTTVPRRKPRGGFTARPQMLAASYRER